MIFPRFKAYAVYACVGVLASAHVAPVAAQAVQAYPLEGQSAEQQRKDELECQMWAFERTGLNPRQRPPQNYSVASGGSRGSAVDPMTFGSGETGQGGVVADGARGAAVGAIGGAIAGNAGKGAAWGALGGAIFGGMKRNQRKQQEADWQRQQQQQVQQQVQRQQQQYDQDRREYVTAMGLCMESRNYKTRY
jgi:hypothetical protein